MTKDRRLQIRLSEEEYRKLESRAKQKDTSMAQVVREYIRRLPLRNPHRRAFLPYPALLRAGKESGYVQLISIFNFDQTTALIHNSQPRG